MTTLLHDLLDPDRLTEVVDIGASPLDGGAPPYGAMLAAGLCRVTGFEPHDEALAQLRLRESPKERYFPYAIGDGGDHELHVCAGPGMTSLLEPEPRTLSLFTHLEPHAKVVRRAAVRTRRLDDVEEVERIDFLKIDAQGAELSVLRSGAAKLATAVAVQAEMPFICLYREQPSFGDIDVELRRQGFVPHCFAHVKHLPIAPMVVAGDRRTGLRQLVEADVVYVRDFSRPEAMTDEQLKHLSLIADHCYGSIDLALRCVMLLEQRGAVKSGATKAYVALVEAAIGATPPK